MIELLGRMGASVTIDERMRIEVDPRTTRETFAPYDLVKTMRASILVLGPLRRRASAQADVSLPGGCAIGARPVNMHVAGLQAMGAEVHIENGYIKRACRPAAGRAHRARDGDGHRHREPDDGRVPRRGRNDPRERGARARGRRPRAVPQRDGGADHGAGTDTHRDRRRRVACTATSYEVLPDRIEAGTYLVAAAITGGRVRARNARPEHLEAVLAKLREAGATVITRRPDWVELDMHGRRPRPWIYARTRIPASRPTCRPSSLALD